MTVRPAKTQISQVIRPDRSESSLCAQWVAKDSSFLHADSEDSDQTGRMAQMLNVRMSIMKTVALTLSKWWIFFSERVTSLGVYTAFKSYKSVICIWQKYQTQDI